MLLPEEKETHISFVQEEVENDELKHWKVYTTQPKMMRRIEKLDIKAYKEELDNDGEVVAKHYKVPFKQIQFVKERKKPNISEERRNELRERMLKIKEDRIKKMNER